jgi:FtsP/CotA-like multicopper oxidase with cupredoxin domain
MHHPFHLHGFSFQPVRMEDPSGETVVSYDYNEFVDTLDIPARHRLVFRVRLDDRLDRDGATHGGAVGRWLFHCHIFFHSGLGMISELVVIP